MSLAGNEFMEPVAKTISDKFLPREHGVFALAGYILSWLFSANLWV
jgi:hypothetical protein